jgi:hypothetical protein
LKSNATATADNLTGVHVHYTNREGGDVQEKEAMMNIDIACFYKQARVFTLKSIRT